MFVKIQQKKVFLEILRQLKEQIRGGALKAGDRLPSERTLSDELGVSRSAVREAVRALEILGLVHCVQGGGNFLASDLSGCLVEPFSMMFNLGGGDILQVQRLRLALEAETAALAAENRTEKELTALREIVDRMNASSDEQERADLDRQLHYAIANIARNPMILSVLNAASSLIESIITDIRTYTINDPSRAAAIDDQHERIFNAILTGNSVLASQVMNEHMRLVESCIIAKQGSMA